MQALEQKADYTSGIMDKTLRDKSRESYPLNRRALIPSRDEYRQGHSTFVEQFLERPSMDEGYSPTRGIQNLLIPTFCTWRIFIVIDDADTW